MSELVDLSIDKANKHSKRDNIEKFALMKLQVLPQAPFRWGIFAPSGGGKSNLIINLLTTKNRLFNYFHRIYIFSPTFHNDDTWDSFIEKYNKDRKGNKKLITEWEQFDSCDEEAIERILEEQKEDIQTNGLDKANRALMIFDDCFGEKELSGSLMKRLFFQGRHYNLSIIIAGQSYMRLPRDLRLQLSNISIFMPNRSEMERISEDNENLYCDKHKLMSLILQACEEKHSFLFINKQADPKKWFRKKFEEIFLLE